MDNARQSLITNLLCRRYAKVDTYKSTWNLDIREYYEVSYASSWECMGVSIVVNSTKKS